MRLLLLGFLLFIFSCKSPRSVKEMNSKESPPPSLDIICDGIGGLKSESPFTLGNEIVNIPTTNTIAILPTIYL